MQNALQLTKYTNLSPLKPSPQKSKKTVTMNEFSISHLEDAFMKAAQSPQKKHPRDKCHSIFQWLLNKGVRKGDPTQIIQNLRQSQRRKIIQRQNLKPKQSSKNENNLMTRRLQKKITINI